MTEWFQLPEAPIKISQRGEWLHGDDPINANVAALFAKHVVAHEDGRYTIEIGQQKSPIEVADTPFHVRSVIETSTAANHNGSLKLLTSDGAEELLDPETLMQSSDNVLYCRVRRGDYMVPCRFDASPYHEIALRTEPEGDRFVLPIGDKRYPIGRYDAKPQKIH